MSTSRKRNSDVGTRHQGAGAAGVGGRQVAGSPPTGGGGYQDICNQFRSSLEDLSKKNRDDSQDPRVGELKAMGLPHPWIEIAETIGFEAFMKAWMILDRENLMTNGQRDTLRVWIPQMHRYLKYQRNLYIRTLAASHSVDEIRARIERELGETLHRNSIMRILHQDPSADAGA